MVMETRQQSFGTRWDPFGGILTLVLTQSHQQRGLLMESLARALLPTLSTAKPSCPVVKTQRGNIGS